MQQSLQLEALAVTCRVARTANKPNLETCTKMKFAEYPDKKSELDSLFRGQIYDSESLNSKSTIMLFVCLKSKLSRLPVGNLKLQC